MGEAVHQEWHCAAGECAGRYDKVLAGAPATVTTKASHQAELESKLPSLMERTDSSTNVWIAYRKGDKNLHREV